MTKLLPLLILPLGVALLEFHGIQFWTVAVTGAWPGWDSWAFLAAWHAWSIPVVLRLGALWAWGQSRAEGWNGGLWTFFAGVLTIAVCLSVLLNVVAPTQVNQAVTQALEEERNRVDAREDAAKDTARRAVGPTGVPYSRPYSELLRTQARSVDLFNEYMALAKAGKITSEGHGRLMLWLLVACVILVELTVVAAARSMGAMGTANSEQPSTDYTDGTDENTGRPRGWTRPGWSYRRWWRRAPAVKASEVYGIFSRAGWLVCVNCGSEGPTAESVIHDWRCPKLTQTLKPHRETAGEPQENVKEEHVSQAAQQGTVGAVAARVENAEAAGADAGESGGPGHAARVREPSGSTGLQEADGAHNLQTQQGHPRRVDTDISEELVKNHVREDTQGDPEEPQAKEPVDARVAAAQRAVDLRFPMVNDLERAALMQLGVSGNRDLSLLRNHEANKKIRGRKLISERALAAIEGAVGLRAPAAAPLSMFTGDPKPETSARYTLEPVKTL